jgi:hypothetical protein
VAEKKGLIEAFKEMYESKDYRASVVVVIHADGMQLITHGTPNAEIECGMILYAINILTHRYNELAAGIARSEEIPQKEAN